MKILFLDDMEERNQLARRRYKDHELYIATEAAEAINFLQLMSPFDLVSLDHDLGGKVFQPSNEVSGAEVARFIAQLPKELQPKTTIIHTWNSVAADTMQHILKDVERVYYEPFS